MGGKGGFSFSFCPNLPSEYTSLVLTLTDIYITEHMALTHCKEPLSMDTSTLCFKDSAQIHAFIKFASPFVEDITKGEVAKAEVVECFLSNKDSYANDARSMLDSFMEQSGISRTYISKAKKATEYRHQTTNAYIRVSNQKSIFDA